MKSVSRQIFPGILCIIFLFACTSTEMASLQTQVAGFTITARNSTKTPRTTATFTPWATSTRFPTHTPSPTFTPSKYSDIWPTPLPYYDPLGTPISSPLKINWTPVPALDQPSASEVFASWLESNADCRFPCWAGIIPGETTLEEAHQFLSPVVVEWVLVSNAKCVFGDCKVFTWYEDRKNAHSKVHGLIFTTQDEIVFAIELESSNFNAYDIQAVLLEYGEPDTIFISTYPPGLEEIQPFYVVLVYPQRQLIVRYVWQAWPKGKSMVSCGEVGSTNVFIGYGDIESWSLERIKAIAYSDNPYPPPSLLMVEDVTGLTKSSFYHGFKKDGAACVYTPMEHWYWYPQ